MRGLAMRITCTFIAIALALSFLASCTGSRNMVVLLSEPDGKTGQVVVSNKGGTQLLDAPKQCTKIQSADTAPTPPVILDDVKIRENFGEAISSLPLSPLHFVLYFKTGTTTLTDESRKLLSDVLPATVSRKSADVSVVGHTDRVGTQADNYQLGLERAKLVKDILVPLGIDSKYIEVASHGEDNPLMKTSDEVPEPKNRRVEVIVR